MKWPFLIKFSFCFVLCGTNTSLFTKAGKTGRGLRRTERQLQNTNIESAPSLTPSETPSQMPSNASSNMPVPSSGPCLTWNYDDDDEDDEPCTRRPTEAPTSQPDEWWLPVRISSDSLPDWANAAILYGIAFLVLIGAIGMLSTENGRSSCLWLIPLVLFIAFWPWSCVLLLLCGLGGAADGDDGGNGNNTGGSSSTENNRNNSTGWFSSPWDNTTHDRQPWASSPAPAPSPERWVVDSGIMNHYGEPARWTRAQ